MKKGEIRKALEQMDKKVYFISLAIVILMVAALILVPDVVKIVIETAFDFCVNKFGWLYILVSVFCFALFFYLYFGEYGNIKFGAPEDKPRFSTFSWAAMIFTSGAGSSTIILGFAEPIYYLTNTPFHIKAMSNKAYEYAHMYGQFHWGFSAWAFYNPAIVAIAYVMYVRKENSIRLSNACRSVLHKKSDGWLGHIVDILVVFGIVGSISTSLGIGAPVLSDIIREVFGIPAQYDFTVKIIVLIIWVLIFGTSVYLGLDKGIQRLSNINVVLAFIFMGLILLIGPTMQIFKMEVNSIGLYASDFIKMSTYTDPFGEGKFSSEWTVFYWGWWIAFMPMMGMFVGKISRGRTIKNVMWGQLLWGTLGCCCSFMIFGGYSLYLQQSGKVDLATILAEEGNSGAIIAILQTLPMSKIMMLFLCIVCFVYLATTIDSCAYVLAGTTTKRLSYKEDPARWNRILWAVLFCVLSIGLMIIGGLEAVKTISVLTGLPLIAVLIVLMVSVKRMLKEDEEKEEKRK